LVQISVESPSPAIPNPSSSVKNLQFDDKATHEHQSIPSLGAPKISQPTSQKSASSQPSNDPFGPPASNDFGDFEGAQDE